MTPERLSVAVLGPGGVGGFLAAVLAREGSSVVVLASDGTSRAISQSGLRVESPRFGSFTASIRTAARLSEPVDACLITVKATQLKDAVDRAPANALGPALVIPFLNGIEHVGFLRAVYPPSTVVPPPIPIQTTKSGPGLIRQTSPFASVEIAAFAANRDRVEPIAAHLMAAGLAVLVRDDELATLWAKCVSLVPMKLLPS